MISQHTLNASEACGRDTGCNSHFANLRAYCVARHYDAANAPPPVDAEPLDAALYAPAIGARWHGTTNNAPRKFCDDAWFQRVTARHLNVLLARERENESPNAGDSAARRVAVHYRFKNAPWI
jgi:hypothetical protein